MYRRELREGLTGNRFPQAPFLQLSASSIFLMQPRGSENRPYPILGVYEPFKQQMKLADSTSTPNDIFSHLANLNYSDRISLHALIPELGVVVIGTPKGRAAVLALFQNRENRMHKTRYSFRMEWLLPTAEQEERGERPETMLIGLAASPVQGMLGEREQGRPRKWRLLLTYADHSVLSYEICGAQDDVDSHHGKATKVSSPYDLMI